MTTTKTRAVICDTFRHHSRRPAWTFLWFVFGLFGVPEGQSLGSLRALWGRLEAFLGRLEAFSGSSWPSGMFWGRREEVVVERPAVLLGRLGFLQRLLQGPLQAFLFPS